MGQLWEIICDILLISAYLRYEHLLLFDHIWAFISINIDALFCLLAFISKPQLEPLPGSQLRDCGLDAKCREYDLIHMIAQCLWGYRTKGLRYKINMHIIQDCLIIKECVLTMPDIFFTRREVVVL
jgi:hypothetical protein